jgi:flagellar L-ring protein precursor FlgH
MQPESRQPEDELDAATPASGDLEVLGEGGDFPSLEEPLDSPALAPTMSVERPQTEPLEAPQARLSAGTAPLGAPAEGKGASRAWMWGAGDRTFDGEGSSSQSNSLQGDITVTVVDRLPNGNLVISGEKWLTINQGEEYIRLTGVIRPYDIEPDNAVFSNRIADAQIAYSSKGVLAAANRMGWLSRFFQSAMYPF